MDRIIIMIVYIKFLHHKNQHKLFFTKDVSMDWYRGFKTSKPMRNYHTYLIDYYTVLLFVLNFPFFRFLIFLNSNSNNFFF